MHLSITFKINYKALSHLAEPDSGKSVCHVKIVGFFLVSLKEMWAEGWYHNKELGLAADFKLKLWCQMFSL